MAKKDDSAGSNDSVVSIIGPGMRVQGDCQTEGTLRIEGVVEGTVQAGKAVVLGKEGVIRGDVYTQDAIIGGKITGKVVAESRLELQATCAIDGEIRARRIKLDEGGMVNGDVRVGEAAARDGARGPSAAGQHSGQGQPGGAGTPGGAPQTGSTG